MHLNLGHLWGLSVFRPYTVRMDELMNLKYLTQNNGYWQCERRVPKAVFPTRIGVKKVVEASTWPQSRSASRRRALYLERAPPNL